MLAHRAVTFDHGLPGDAVMKSLVGYDPFSF